MNHVTKSRIISPPKTIKYKSRDASSLCYSNISFSTESVVKKKKVNKPLGKKKKKLKWQNPGGKRDIKYASGIFLWLSRILSGL